MSAIPSLDLLYALADLAAGGGVVVIDADALIAYLAEHRRLAAVVDTAHAWHHDDATPVDLRAALETYADQRRAVGLPPRAIPQPR